MQRAQEIHAAGLRAMMLLALLGGPFVACAWAAQPATALGGRTSARSETGGGVAPTGGVAGSGGVSVVDSGGAGGGDSGGAGGGGSGGARGGTPGSPGDGGSRNGGSASGGIRAAGGSSAGGASGGSGGMTANSGRPSAGCGLPGTSGRQDLTVNIRGTQRQYRVQFPTSYAPNTPLPLVFYFHWLDGSVNDVVSLQEPAVWEVGNAAQEAAFVWPQGLAKYDNGLTGWDVTCGGEDMEFFDAMLSQLAEDRCIDLSRVFSTGFSFGADMSNALACCRGREVIRAVAPASGSLSSNQVCPASELPAIRFSYGTKDTAYSQKDFQDVVTFYLGKLRCGTDYDSVPVAPCGKTWTGDSSTVSCACKSYRGCDQPVIDCMFTNMPHTTAAGWRDDTWAFFRGFGPEK